MSFRKTTSRRSSTGTRRILVLKSEDVELHSHDGKGTYLSAKLVSSGRGQSTKEKDVQGEKFYGKVSADGNFDDGNQLDGEFGTTWNFGGSLRPRLVLQLKAQKGSYAIIKK